jgi:predicted DNA-binding ribbon-helix-helix protein
MTDARTPQAVVKRSLAIAGHATSISLEAAFWEALRQLAAERGVSLSALVAEVDRGRGDQNLSSALRVHVLRELQARLEATRPLS